MDGLYLSGGLSTIIRKLRFSDTIGSLSPQYICSVFAAYFQGIKCIKVYSKYTATILQVSCNYAAGIGRKEGWK
jgi:hypothetical protein